ncbi:MAG: cupin domain-containing protein [Rhodobacteraceae bacterium]|nr:cupin domain-containing protein [Paracoccaceae bacterium]
MTVTAAKPARTPGAHRAQEGEYLFQLRDVNHLMGGPEYSTANGSCVEGDRMIIALMTMPKGTGAEPHSHPNEQWIFVMEGKMRMTIDGSAVEAGPNGAIYIPSNALHEAQSVGEVDAVFFTVKDASHSLHGIKA